MNRYEMHGPALGGSLGSLLACLDIPTQVSLDAVVSFSKKSDSRGHVDAELRAFLK